MPTKPPKIKRRDNLLGDLSPAIRAYFLDETEMPHEAILMADEDIKALWLAHVEELTQKYVSGWPGFRPPCWWRHSAPRAKHLFRGRYVEMEEPRRLLSGSGEPRHEVSAYAITFYSGLPFMSRVDPRNPPTFESSPAYLRRHNLFLPGEAEQMSPEDFEPEPLERDLWTTESI